MKLPPTPSPLQHGNEEVVVVNVTYENDENETELMKQGRDIVPLPDSHGRGAGEGGDVNDEEEVEVIFDKSSKKYFVAKIKEEGEEKGQKPVSQTKHIGNWASTSGKIRYKQ